MAGIYIHVPFCKTKCPYCDFYSITNFNPDFVQKLLKAIQIELELRREFFNQPVETIYFGGGTPSLIKPADLQRIIEKIGTVFRLKPNAEITIELNPEDATYDYLKQIREETQINRLSLGVQSFLDRDLKFLGRRHNVKHSLQALEHSLKLGFYNTSIDLIYGLPGSSTEDLMHNLKTFSLFALPHLSAYHLTIEENTPFGKLYQQGKLRPIDEELSVKLYDLLMDYMEKQGYLHYEISNFAKPGYLSKHNFNYWTGKPYLGVGPAAHSYNIYTRQWNPPDVHLYVNQLLNRKLVAQIETLSDKDKFNEYIMTRLRTYQGIDITFLAENYPKFFRQIQPELRSLIEQNFLEQKNNTILLTRKGKHIADNIIAQLFVV